MRNHMRRNGSERTGSAFEEGDEREFALALAAQDGESDDADEAFEDEFGDVVRLACPDCGRPIAVFTDEESLPQHALCPTPGTRSASRSAAARAARSTTPAR